MKPPLTTVAAAVSTTFAAVLLAMLAACGGQQGRPAPSAPSASTSPAAPSRAAVPSQAATPGQPSSGRSLRRLVRPGSVILACISVALAERRRSARARHPRPRGAAGSRAAVQISVGSHPAESGERPFERISFTFTTAFPSYRFEFAGKMASDPGGKVIPLGGQDVLEIVFTQAQAHTADGTHSSITSQPVPRIGYQRMADYAQAGDFEGVLTYGIGIIRPVLHPNPQFAVRAYEVETVAVSGQHRYTVAIDIDAGNPGR